VVCSPDYSDATKFADEWLSPAPGTDGALAMAMGHVILREFFVERQVPYDGRGPATLAQPRDPGPRSAGTAATNPEGAGRARHSW